MEIKRIDRNNFTRDSLKGFQRYQEVKKVYRLRNGNLTLVDNPFTEDWDAARLTEKAEEILSGKFVTYGAFEGNRVVGEIMLVPGLNKGRLIIDSFHVSRDYRRHGIGRALFEAARQEALKMGAHALYASCCSSEETINFYSAMGFRLSPDPIPSLAEAEPYDLQMECPILRETPAENMIRWAESRLGSTKYAGWCLAFIEDALEISNHIEIFGGDSAKESCGMYRDALRGGVPERGAFVFYDCLCPGENGPVNWGHCGISLGDGRVIHAWDIVRIDDFLAIEKMTALTGDHPKYLGWVPLERVLKQKPSEQEGVSSYGDLGSV